MEIVALDDLQPVNWGGGFLMEVPILVWKMVIG